MALVAALLFSLSLWAWAKPDGLWSQREERKLTQLEAPRWRQVTQGSYDRAFQTYAQDQFPCRDGFRALQALTALEVLGQRDREKVYAVDGVTAQMEFPLKTKMVGHAARRVKTLYEDYLAGTQTKLYCAVIPGKHHLLGPANGYPCLELDEMVRRFRTGLPPMVYVPLDDLLTIEDFYKTDSHWRQENILDVAQRLAGAMGTTLTDHFARATLPQPFTGRYASQLGLPLPGEPLHYLTSPTLAGCRVTVYNEMGRPEAKPSVYDREMAGRLYPYNLFLSGSKGLVEIVNPQGPQGRELVLFRDSFGSSLAPLLVSGYEKITLVDLRYLSSARLGDYINFTDQDVLFLYSTLLLNNSLAMG